MNSSRNFAYLLFTTRPRPIIGLLLLVLCEASEKIEISQHVAN